MRKGPKKHASFLRLLSQTSTGRCVLFHIKSVFFSERMCWVREIRCWTVHWAQTNDDESGEGLEYVQLSSSPFLLVTQCYTWGLQARSLHFRNTFPTTDEVMISHVQSTESVRFWSTRKSFKNCQRYLEFLKFASKHWTWCGRSEHLGSFLRPAICTLTFRMVLLAETCLTIKVLRWRSNQVHLPCTKS